jgi:hypothetical protein
MLVFALAGAIVGAHQHWLHGLKTKKQAAAPELLPAGVGVETG